MAHSLPSLGILVSGFGSNLQAILDACAQGKLPAKVSLVISDQAQAYALQRAQQSNVPVLLCEKGTLSKIEFEQKMLEALQKASVDWIVLAGFMRILSQHFLSFFPQRVINLHPSLLPAFPGLNSIERAWEEGVKYTGCTVHLVDEGCDTGPILDQRVISVESCLDLEDLKKKIHEAEHELLVSTLLKLLTSKLSIKGKRTFFSHV